MSQQASQNRAHDTTTEKEEEDDDDDQSFAPMKHGRANDSFSSASSYWKSLYVCVLYVNGGAKCGEATFSAACLFKSKHRASKQMSFMY